MAAALWSSPEQRIDQFPAQALVQFMQNHCMLQINDRPPWRVVKGGSARYVDALLPQLAKVDLRLHQPVTSVERRAGQILVSSQGQQESFDQVIFACHSDQALRLLSNPSSAEQEVLSALPYQANEVLLHTDTRLLPRRRRAWAAWNALKLRDAGDRCT
ncbi:MAG: FAD-dependent oxidoreductase, partial [Planctomycetaceae bacterium]|nr:FAD-dependent oxidoreductase [Planctomycetaceae bacterium]